MQKFAKIAIFLAKIAAAAALVFLLWHRQIIDLSLPETYRRAYQEIKEKFETPPAERKFPELSGPQTVRFEWQYAGRKYSLDQTLYASVLGFYASSPKTFTYQGELPADWEEKYFQMFTEIPAGDGSITDLARALEALAQKNKLDADRTVELVLAFVQTVPYDDAKAKLITSGTDLSGGVTNYPYETLFEKQGVCSDKSLLAYVLLRELGYGAALFVYEEENHMAVAVQCTRELSSYASGYCYAETTTPGNLIGVIPQLDAGDNRAVVAGKLPDFSADTDSFFDVKRLGEVKILSAFQGEKTYTGIDRTRMIARQIETTQAELEKMRANLAAQRKKIKAQEEELSELQEDAEDFRRRDDLENYNETVEDYNALAKKYKKAIKDYNDDVKAYNAKVAKLNSLTDYFQ